MPAPKKRIHEIAKELGLDSWKPVAELLERDFGVPVKSHSSTIELDLAEKVKAAYNEQKSGKKSSEVPAAPEKAAPADTEPSASAATDKPKKQAVLIASSQQTKAAPQLQSAPVPEKQPAKPAVASASGAATSASKASATAVKEALPKPAVEDEPLAEEEDDAILEILQPAVEEEPFAPIAETIVRQQQKVENKPAVKPRPVDAVKPAQAPPRKDFRPQHTQQPAAVSSGNKAAVAAAEAVPTVIEIDAPLSIAELAARMKKRETELIRHLFMKGVMVTVNQTMQVDDAVGLAIEMGFDARAKAAQPDVDQYTAPELKVRHAKGHHLKPRAPVVSIMGHVDHGKTSLLDAIRESRHNIVDTEAGGITQSIGAYSVTKDDHKIVFIDTPGHEAFTAMRMRGAQATDIAILVVAADDGVMPQTIEAINHAKAASIPIIVAINKIDKADADPDRVLSQLAEHGLTPEKWGGDTIAVEVSALQKLGLDDLLEMILLVSELQDLKADPTIPAEGVVIEARLDKGKGPVATVLVQNGTLHVGENLLIRKVGGRVRALISDAGERVKSAGPSTPVEILGLADVPQAGEPFIVVRNDKEFKRLLQQHQGQEREQRLARMAAPGLVSIDKDGQRKEFHLIIKADTQGSVEALSNSILRLATEEVSIKIVHGGTGDISEADVLLASASEAVIIAFNVKEEANAQRAAQDQGIEIRPYDVIYHVTEDVEKMMLGLLSPETEEQELGAAEVRQLFSFGKTTIAGCYVTEGKITRNALARVFRNNKEIFRGTLDNLKRFKEDAKEVASGYECGISFDRFNDLQPGDLIRVFTMKEVERTSL